MTGLPPKSFYVNGLRGYDMLPNTLHISLSDDLYSNDVLNVGNYLACSAGSACSTAGSTCPDSAHAGVMSVIGTKIGYYGGNLRLSVGRATTIDEI